MWKGILYLYACLFVYSVYIYGLVNITHHLGIHKGYRQNWIWCSQKWLQKFRPLLHYHPQTLALLLDSPPTRHHSLGTLPINNREKKSVSFDQFEILLIIYTEFLLQKHSLCQCLIWFMPPPLFFFCWTTDPSNSQVTWIKSTKNKKLLHMYMIYILYMWLG